MIFDTTAKESQFESSQGIPEMAEYALARGWSIFPVHHIEDGRCSCGDPSCGSPGKHPRVTNGVKAATGDRATIERWAATWPEANWAVATGEASGVFVVDLDVKGDGAGTLNAWLSERGLTTLPETLVVATGGGGWHYYFVADHPIKNKVRLLPGVDVRGDGGYVLLPGSNHISGGIYSVAREAEVRHSPEALVGLIATPPLPPAANAGGGLLDPVPEGSRNDTLFRMACGLRRSLRDSREAVDLLVRERGRRSGLSDPEIDTILRSAFDQDHSDSYPDPFALTPEDAPRLNLRSAGEVRTLPRPPYLIEGVIPEGGLFQVFGQTGSYKSFVMLDMLASVANGIEWMGHPVTAPGPVAFVLGEGGYDAGARVDAWMLAHPEATDAHLAYSIEEQLDLMHESSVAAITEDLEAYRADHFPEEPWRLIVFDTQADHMPHGDEDKSRDFTVMKRAIQRIAHETGAAVGLVHHTGWDDSRERGSSRQRQALDVVMQVRAQRVTNIKQKGGPLFSPIDFDVVQSGDSVFVRKSNPFVAAAETMDADLDTGREVLNYLVDNPGASANAIISALRLGRSGKWERVRDLLVALGYLAVEVDSRGRFSGATPTRLGLDRLGIEAPE